MVSVSYQAIPWFSAVWSYVSSTTSYTNSTIEARLSGGTAFSILAASTNYLYLGSESRFDLAAWDLSTVGSLGTLTWEYSSSATAWTQFVPAYNYDFTVDGAEAFVNLPDWTARTFSTSSPHTVSSVPDSTTRYWIRVSASSVSTAPTVNQIWMRPYAAYCRYTDVANVLQLTSDFSSSTTPTANTVEDAIAAAQSHIEYYTQKSWRINYQTNEYHDFNTSGTTLVKNDAFFMTRVEVWNGSSFETRTEGRENDYFLVPDFNKLQWSRFFLLPARFAAASSSLGWWGYGEFLQPVRVSYLYGRNIYTDNTQGRMAFDITRKLAAIDVYQAHDYSILAVSGSDKVTLENKIRNWKEEIDDKLDKLRGWRVF